MMNYKTVNYGMPQTFQQLMLSRFDASQLVDIAKYGCENGFFGLTNYAETTAIYSQFKDEIWQFIRTKAESLRCGVMDYLSQCIRSNSISYAAHFETQLVWLCAQLIAQHYVYKTYNSSI